MKAHLMYPDRDLNVDAPPVAGEEALIADLELGHVLAAMARGDRFLFEISRSVLLHSLDAPEHIMYRQNVLRDFLGEPDVARKLFVIATDALQGEKTFWLGSANTRPESVVHRSVRVLTMFMEQLARLRAIAEQSRDRFRSDGLNTLLETISHEVDDAYVAEVEGHVAQLQFRHGIRTSARLGEGNEGTDYVLHATERRSWRERIRWHRGDSLVVQIADRDDAGHQALGEIRERGLRPVALALSQATQHLLDFFEMLHTELAFYIGCLNLHETLAEKQQRVCFPEPLHTERPALVAHGLYDPALSLLATHEIVGNDLNADSASVIFITGANRGGKSTLLRAIGSAQLMMQCGMYVAADSYRSEPRAPVFTHFKREEDASMASGKLDEELRRMSGIVDNITPMSLLLCNESFASTNESEGSEIAREVIAALRDAGVKVVYVTHLFELAHEFHRQACPDALFLRARPSAAGERPFVVTEGEPIPTSHGADIYARVFGHPPVPGTA
jgi:DNA mismatch repair ATPase MutS